MRPRDGSQLTKVIGETTGCLLQSAEPDVSFRDIPSRAAVGSVLSSGVLKMPMNRLDKGLLGLFIKTVANLK